MTTLAPPKKIALPGRWNDPDFHLSTYIEGEQHAQAPAVVFCHGFPDLARGWHHQLAAVSRAGFLAIAPDMRGYGGSSRPEEVEAYTLAELTGDLVALLDALDIEKAVFVGHDWGGFVVWGMPVLHPERVAGIAAACTPYIPFPSVAEHTAVVDGDIERQYVAWFQQPGVAETHMDQHVADIVAAVMRTHAPLEEVIAAALADGKLNMNPFLNIAAMASLGEPLLDAEEFAYYVDAFTRSGYRGGINWYRNIDGNAQAHPEVGVQALSLPCLMLMAAEDPALRPEFAADMPERCSNLEMQLIEKAGHWVQYEQPERVNGYLVDWLQRHFTGST